PGNVEAIAIEKIAAHDRSPMERPRGKGCAYCPGIARQIARSNYFLFAFSQAFPVTRLARYSESVAYRSAFALPGKCLTGRPFRLTVHQPLGGPCGPDSVGTTS